MPPGTGLLIALTSVAILAGGCWSVGGLANNGKIAFQSNRDGNWEIYVMDSDGSGQTRLTSNDMWDSLPSWSPDNSKIVFESNRDGKFEIYVMDSDGSGQTRLTNNTAEDYYPDWGPAR
jgi:Tol biopolymer transport system component